MGDRGNRNAIPNRWLRCPRKSTNLIANTFIVFKTPLSDRYDDQVPADCRFPPKMLFELCKSKKIKIGLWIDLTNTSRFYNKTVVENENCKYFKLQCRGHGETPSEEQTNLFVSMCHNFVSMHPLEVIAVHCTHGFNRSGFLIVSYMVNKMDCSLEGAMQEFAFHRPPGIYKQDYIDELYRRYGDVNDAPDAPPLPDWCNEEENYYDRDEDESLAESSGSSSDNLNNIEGGSSSGGSTGRKSSKKNGKQPVFMTGVPGVHPVEEHGKVIELQRKIQKMCEWKNFKDFPGCQPVSMDRQNIQLLHQKPYRVSWKADGTRYMMLIDGEDEVYFFDRDNNVFKVDNIRFVYKKDLRRHLTNTLVDGEMVIDSVNDEKIPRFLIYDIIKFEKQDVGKMEFYPIRMKCISDEIIKPRYAAIERGYINKLQEPFSIRNKEFWDVTQAGNLLGERFAKSLSHEPDGLIFQPSKEPYVAGRCDSVLKWKPLELNSVDFRLKIDMISGEGLVPKKVGKLFVNHQTTPFAITTCTKAMKDLDNKIIECKFENNKWVFMRERTDKSFPNSVKTARAVCNSILNPITKEDLLNFIHTKRFIDDSEIMPPPSKKIRR